MVRAFLLLVFVLPLWAEEDGKKAPEKETEKEAEKVTEERREAVAKFAQAQRANRRKFHGHSWQQLEDIRLERETRARRSFLMRLDDKGALQAILRSSTLVQSKNPKLRFAVTDADRKASRELIRWVETAEAVLNKYVYYPTDEMARVLLRAEVKPGRGAYENALQATGRGLVQPGDLVRVWLDPKTLQPLRLQYQARVGGIPVTGWVTYRDHKATGGYFPDRSEMDCRAKKIKLILRNTTPVAPPQKKKD